MQAAQAPTAFCRIGIIGFAASELEFLGGNSTFIRLSSRTLLDFSLVLFSPSVGALHVMVHSRMTKSFIKAFVIVLRVAAY